MKELLHTTGLAVGFPGKVLARGMDLDMRSGELTALIGLNGCGKSTLLRTLAGLIPPLDGTIEVEGRQLTVMGNMERARAMSVVLTGRPQAGLLDVRTIVSLGRQPWTGHMGRLSPQDHQRVRDAMERTGISAFAERDLRSLSDGEGQKVMIARALAQEAPIMLLDEPTAYLDLVNRISVMHLLRAIARDMQRSILLSTHDLGSALQLCDRIVLLHGGSSWTGTPPEAIASGVLDRAFASEGFRFDPDKASLVPG